MSNLVEPEKLIDLYITAVRDVELTRLTSFVVATIVIYDSIITIDREVELIWKKRWSIIKTVYLWHRYFGILCVIFQVIALNYTGVNDGNFWIHWETWGYSALIYSSEVVLVLWIWVVYNQNKALLTVLLCLFSAEVTGVTIILILSFRNLTGTAHLIPGLTYCFARGSSPLFKFLWVPILSFDTILLISFLCQGYKTRGISNRNSNSAMQMIYAHSLPNFLAIFGSYLSCAIMWIAAEPGLLQIPVGFALALSITNCTRLLLNIRRAYYIGPSHIRLQDASAMVVHSDDLILPDSDSSLVSLEWARGDPSTDSMHTHIATEENTVTNSYHHGYEGTSGSSYELQEFKSVPEP